MDEMTRQFLGEFLLENREQLELLDGHLVALEANPGDGELLGAVFREMHTIKGNCRMMGFVQLEGLCHQAETLLDQLRNRTLRLNRAITQALLATLDAVRDEMIQIETRGEERPEGHPHLSAELKQLAEAGEALGEEPLDGQGARENPVEGEQGAPAGGAAHVSPDDTTIRLSIEKLGHLMDMSGELGAAFGQLIHLAEGSASQEFFSTAERVQAFIGNLQDELLQFRLQPVGRIWQPYHRLVRDLATSTGKRVLLNLEGSDTEVDRAILAAIKDPLVHLLRNAVDHGIETPDVRTAHGKPPHGTVTLRAALNEGRIILEIADDGRGMDGEALREQAVFMGLIDREEALRLEGRELLDLMFLPGFSTAAQLSAISGRGIGMDVVREALKRVGGAIDITTTPGAGTRFRIRIPQTMAIVSALMVEEQGERYGIPRGNIVELISLYGAKEVAREVEFKMQRPMLRVRGNLYPLVPLGEVFHDGPGPFDMSAYLNRNALHTVLVQSDTRRVALAVEEIGGIAELVSKPLSGALGALTLYAGAAILPDGRVTLLLDISRILDEER